MPGHLGTGDISVQTMDLDRGDIQYIKNVFFQKTVMRLDLIPVKRIIFIDPEYYHIFETSSLGEGPGKQFVNRYHGRPGRQSQNQFFTLGLFKGQKCQYVVHKVRRCFHLVVINEYRQVLVPSAEIVRQCHWAVS